MMARPCEAQKIVITAIPELLNILDIEGCIITIDAMGTQKKMYKTLFAGNNLIPQMKPLKKAMAE